MLGMQFKGKRSSREITEKDDFSIKIFEYIVTVEPTEDHFA